MQLNKTKKENIILCAEYSINDQHRTHRAHYFKNIFTS